MTMDKTYFQKYYQDHKGEYRRRARKWYKNNPAKGRAKSQRYRDKFLQKEKVITNRTNYSVKLNDAYIGSYGKDLECQKDDINNLKFKIRIFCMDCLHYKKSKYLDCPGWEECPYKQEIIDLINKKGGKANG